MSAGALGVPPDLLIGLASLSTLLAVWLSRSAETQHRSGAPAAWEFRNLMLIFALWCGGYVASLVSSNPAAIKIYYQLQDVGTVFAGGFFLVFALRYSNREFWLDYRPRMALFVPPVAYATAVLTNGYHGLVYSSIDVVSTAGIAVGTADPGPLQFGGLVLAGVYAIAGVLLLTMSVFRFSTHHRMQALLLVISSGTLFSIGLGHSVGIIGNEVIRPVPLVFSAVAVIGWLGLFRYDFLKTAPFGSTIALDSMAEGVLVTDSRGTLIDFNSTAEEILDDLPDASGSKLDDFYPDIVNVAKEGETISNVEGVSADGGCPTVYQTEYSDVTDGRGVIRGGVYTLREITAQKRREDMLECLQTVSRELMQAKSEDMVTQILTREGVLDSLGCARWVLYRESTKSDTTLEIAAKSDEHISQLAAKCATSDPLNEVHMQDRTTVFTDDSKLQGLGADLLDDDTADWMMCTPLGEHGVFVIMNPTIGADDDMLFYYEILGRTIRAALDRVQHMNKLRDRREAIERRKQEIEFFNGILRHDILNGMTVINANIDFLDQTIDDPEAQEYIDTLDTWSDDVIRLTQEVRKITKTVTDETGEEVSLINLSSAVRDRVTKVDQAHSDVDIELSCEPELVVSGNELVEEIIENLLLNAIEHNESGNLDIYVRTHTVSDGRVRLEIADNGSGIPDDRKEEVFEKGVSENGSATSGFGLYFVRTMMEHFGGGAWFEDNEYGGATAVLEFQLDPTGPVDGGEEIQEQVPE